MESRSPLTLRKRPASFLEGFAELFSDAPLSESYRTYSSASLADAHALAGDVRVIGSDMRRALANYAQA